VSLSAARQWIPGLLLLAGLGSGSTDDPSRQFTSNQATWDTLSKACDTCWTPEEGELVHEQSSLGHVRQKKCCIMPAT
jgi:hypothetical protein